MIPVHLVSGLLGAGKSTWLAAQPAATDPRSRLVVNDVAGLMPDDDLVDGPGVTRIAGGCVCCDAAGDLATVLRGLCEQSHGGEQVEAIVVEMSGVSDPTAVVEHIREDPVLRVNLVVDEVTVVVDGLLGLAGLHHEPLAVRQLAAADRVVVSKGDLAARPALLDLIAAVRAVAPTARIELPVNPHGIDPQDVEPAPLSLPTGAEGGAVDLPSTAVEVPVDGAEWTVLATWLAALLHAHGDALLRLKAAVDTPRGPLVLNAVRGVMHAPRPRRRALDSAALTLVVRGLEPDDVIAGWDRFRSAAPVPAATRPDQEVFQ